MMRHIHAPAAALLCALSFSPAMAEPMAIPPQALTFDALGTTVSLPVVAEVGVTADGDQRIAAGSVVGNLGDLQAKALPIAQAIPLPRDQCGNPNGINVVVDAIESAAIEAAGETARLSLLGTVTGYGCLMGIGAPVATTQMAIAAPLRIDVASPTDIGLALAGPVELVAAGLPVEIVDLLRAQVTEAVDAALARARTQGDMSIGGLPELDLVIEGAKFFAEGETLMVEFEGTSRMDAETFAAFADALGATPPAGF